MRLVPCRRVGVLLAAGTLLLSAQSIAGPLAMTDPTSDYPSSIFDELMRPPAAPPVDAEDAGLAAQLRRQVVAYPTAEAPGTVVVDTAHTYLYFVLGGGKAIRYGIGVGREGFTWSGVQTVARKAEWPDWIPPDEMLQRQPYLPRLMAGGPGNPLGARALYLGNTNYRIHGTNAPETIGQRVSSGCIRLLNADVIDLYSRVNVGTKVVVLPNNQWQVPVAQVTRPAAASAQVTYPSTTGAPGASVASLLGIY
jgi:lipoprotein-anchoring transpeptidase ErfK/SrfK